eukprot:TRINITY_DN3476_c0_g4_i1.p1 TRINITY_DN3476_c0_g4~~TRINITY_DN3476_c0_g4_i1.p1  ORF type:complete len:332 (+),score=71.37 TRINITY_DN3476_c0_g4_i1:99-998(+)
MGTCCGKNNAKGDAGVEKPVAPVKQENVPQHDVEEKEKEKKRQEMQLLEELEWAEHADTVKPHGSGSASKFAATKQNMNTSGESTRYTDTEEEEEVEEIEEEEPSSPLLPPSPYNDRVRVTSPEGLLHTAVTPDTGQFDGTKSCELLKVKIHITQVPTNEPDNCYYAISRKSVLASFCHVRLAKVFPCDSPLVIDCKEESDLIIAVKQGNPCFLQSDFQRVITNNSYSRFLVNGPRRIGPAPDYEPQIWYRLYHRQLSSGVHTISFNTKKSLMNSFTLFLRPCSVQPPLDITPIPDDSS